MTSDQLAKYLYALFIYIMPFYVENVCINMCFSIFLLYIMRNLT
ncbi:hypothetical protein Phi18:2_gp27 [Cellulophaga phage phi18:2]|uniref:Uncharacterized protein n=2 Tax=Cellulophaga phage phi18:1 TaxID=1327982 RepID=S0A2Y9_9CAUD|nr:hypothetical protein Phi18:1_gp27 [Cellulophaga phage phi18:1]AGO48474.1 hypothetical protein Phi18:1_gp27 [Cellulophaga phage phi18:1]AGO49190.1 hypothetical protein Phi18:2_gp27 [Cellulophaga phage phi18:2]